MLNLLPALIFFLVQGSGDPEALRFREQTLRLIIVQAQRQQDQIEELNWVSSESSKCLDQQAPHSLSSDTKTYAPNNMLERVGIGSAVISRDGPAA